jgi:hypothetical protein
MGRKKKDTTLSETIFEKIRKPIAPPMQVLKLKHDKDKYKWDSKEYWPVGDGLTGKE